MKKRDAQNVSMKTLRFMRIGGYIILLGVLIGIVLGVYSYLNPLLFTFFINLSQFESTFFFSTIYLPSSIILVAIGYFFATSPKFAELSSVRTIGLCTLILLSFVLSALSVFNMLSFLGGIILLTVVIYAHGKPTFRVLWKREAFFLVEMGPLLIATAFLLFLAMWLISTFLQTYSVGILELNHSYLYVLIIVGVLSLSTSFLTFLLSMRNSYQWFGGVLSWITSIMASLTIVQSQYVYFNPTVFAGVLLGGVGTILTFAGAILHSKLILSQPEESPAPNLRLPLSAKYCFFCGQPQVDTSSTQCANCGRSPSPNSKISFCPNCGRFVSFNTVNCPHCMEDFGSLRLYTLPRKRQEKSALETTSRSMRRLLSKISLKSTIYIVILTSLFVFASILGYTKIEGPKSIASAHPLERAYIYTYGLPLEWLSVYFVYSPRGYLNRTFVDIAWASLISTIFLYILSAYFALSGIQKLLRMTDYRMRTREVSSPHSQNKEYTLLRASEDKK
jgi:hypothetical protein